MYIHTYIHTYISTYVHVMYIHKYYVVEDSYSSMYIKQSLREIRPISMTMINLFMYVWLLFLYVQYVKVTYKLKWLHTHTYTHSYKHKENDLIFSTFNFVRHDQTVADSLRVDPQNLYNTVFFLALTQQVILCIIFVWCMYCMYNRCMQVRMYICMYVSIWECEY